jgi:hypothetical protein
MAQPIILIDISDVNKGALEQLKSAMAELADFVESSGTRAIAYAMYLSQDGRLMTVVQVHPDAASIVEQMTAAAPIFAKFASLLTMRAMDVYGEPSDSLLEVLRRKADKLGLGGPPTVHTLQAGFDSFG